LNSHLTVAALDICELKLACPPEGITPEIEKRLRCRKKAHPDQTEEDRWKDIYRILFPDTVVPSPCKSIEA
jgi:hypothetical protein